MSTQTQMTQDQAATFLKERITVVGTNEAIETKDREFLTKYSTVVGSLEAIDIVAPETDPTSVVPEEDPTEPTVPPTEPEEPTDPAGVGEGTDEQGD